MADTWLEWFVECFEDRIAFVKQNCMDRVEGVMLLTAHLDALAGYCYWRSSSLERFKDLLCDYSGDAETWSKVSLYTLYVELISKDKDKLRELGENLFTRLEIHKYDRHFNADCSLQALRESLDIEPKGFMKVVQKCDYASILWSLRNEAVHESLDRNKPFLNPFGQGHEPSAPYYDCGNVEFVQVKKFIIPNSYILRTLEDCLRNFRDACTSGDFNFKAMRRSKRKAY